MHSFINTKTLIGLAIFAGVFLFAVSIADNWRDKELRRDALLLSPGMQKEEVVRILGEPDSEHLSMVHNSLFCFTSDSFGRVENDCGPVAVGISPYGRVTKVIIANSPPTIIE
jgi:hypothetical protein